MYSEETYGDFWNLQNYKIYFTMVILYVHQGFQQNSWCQILSPSNLSIIYSVKINYMVPKLLFIRPFTKKRILF